MEQGSQKPPYYTVYPVASAYRYGLCVGNRGAFESIQVDAWAKTLTAALELETQAIAALEPLGYVLGTPTRTLKDETYHRRVMTLRRYI